MARRSGSLGCFFTSRSSASGIRLHYRLFATRTLEHRYGPTTPRQKQRDPRTPCRGSLWLLVDQWLLGVIDGQ